MANQLENILSKIIKYGLYAVLLTPLAFWPKALFPFLTPKFILFQILIEMVFGAWLVLKIIDFRNQKCPDFGNQLFVRKNYIVLAILLFFTVSFISALFGIDFSRSFWGLGARMTGLFAELHFLAWFFVLISFLKTREEWSRYLNFSFAVALIVAATAFYQNSVWGLSFGSTIFNNPTFVAPYLIFHFFYGLYKFIGFRNLYFLGGGALLLAAIILGQVRGAILGLLASILLLLIVLILSDIFSKRIRILLAACFLVILIAIAGFWQFRNTDFLRNSSLRKFTEISLANTTVKTRLLTWQAALDGLRDRPLLGTGPENFNILFNAHYSPKLLKYGISETWFDKPHNAFLEILTETGLIGTLSYVLIWIAVGLALFKLFKRENKILSLILTSSFIAYFGSVFFSFDSFGSWFGLFLMLGFLASHNNNNTNDTNRYTNDTNKGSKSVSRIFVSFACLFVLLVLLYVNYGIWRANITNADALRTFPKDIERGIALFKKSLNYFTPYKAEYRLDLFTGIGSALQTNHPLPNPEETINFVLAEADKIIVDHPKDAAYYTNFVKLYNIFGEKGRDPGILDIAETYGRKSLELSPNRQETLFYITKTFLLKGDTNSAVIHMLKAVNAELSIGLSHWYYGLALIADGQQEKGVAEIKKAIELGYAPQNEKEKDFIKNLGL